MRLSAGLGLSITATGWLVLWWITRPYLGEFDKLIVFGYGKGLLWKTLAVWFNLSAAIYWLSSAVSWNRTGRKLEHIDYGLQHGASVSQELSRRLAEE